MSAVFPIERGTHRDRKLLDLAHEAPCCLQIAGVVGCGNNASVPCHSDQLRHGRGVGHKSHDLFSVAGCPACHEAFTRKNLGHSYDDIWLMGYERYQLWLWRSGRVRVA